MTPRRTGRVEVRGGGRYARCGPGKAAAVASAQLVLGRYCLRPERYTLTAAELNGWLRVGVLVVGLDRSGDGPAILLELLWTGSRYDWSGAPEQLRGC